MRAAVTAHTFTLDHRFRDVTVSEHCRGLPQLTLIVTVYIRLDTLYTLHAARVVSCAVLSDVSEHVYDQVAAVNCLLVSKIWSQTLKSTHFKATSSRHSV